MDKNLPEMCFTLIESNPPGKYVGAIKRGEMGYFATTYDVEDLEKARGLVEHLNTNKLGVTPAEVEAMQIGSMMGWDVPGAQLSAHKVPMAKEIPDADFMPIKLCRSWDEGLVSTDAKLDLMTGVVFDIEKSDIGQDYERLIEKYVTTLDGKSRASVEMNHRYSYEIKDELALVDFRLIHSKNLNRVEADTASILPPIAEKVTEQSNQKVESLEATIRHQALVIKDLQLSLGTALEQARGVEVTREQFMEFFRGDKFNTDLSPEDKREIFVNSLAGQDDLSIPLFEEVCKNYDTTFKAVVEDHEQARLASFESLMKAHQIVGGKGGMEARFKPDGEYTGRILGVTDLHVIQNIGRTANIYDKTQLDSIPIVGDEVKIVLKKGVGQVMPTKSVETEVAR